MSRSKKKPGQDPEVVQTEEPVTDTEETPAEEQEQPTQEDPQEDPAEEQLEEEPAEDGQDDPAEDQEPAQDGEEVREPPTAEDPAPADNQNAELQAQLLEARSQLAAYSAGVAPGMIADAVTLATAEARKAGEVTEAAIAKAMENVLKRHPEWKADAGKSGVKKTGGFRLGADRDAESGRKPESAPKNQKRWNRFK